MKVVTMMIMVFDIVLLLFCRCVILFDVSDISKRHAILCTQYWWVKLYKSSIEKKSILELETSNTNSIHTFFYRKENVFSFQPFFPVFIFSVESDLLFSREEENVKSVEQVKWPFSLHLITTKGWICSFFNTNIESID